MLRSLADSLAGSLADWVGFGSTRRSLAGWAVDAS